MQERSSSGGSGSSIGGDEGGMNRVFVVAGHVCL